MAKKTRTVEYYRLWPGNGGDSGTWDTDYIEIPADTPEDKIAEAVRAAAEKLRWRNNEPPIEVGVYCDEVDAFDDDEEDEDG